MAIRFFGNLNKGKFVKTEEPKEDIMNNWKDRDALASYNLDHFSNEQDLGSFLKGFDLSDLGAQEMEDLAFEERDIMEEQLEGLRPKALVEKAKREKEAIEREAVEVTPFNEQDIPDYSVFEFKIMQNAFRYKTFMDKFPIVEEKRPKDAEKNPFTDKEIDVLLKKYYQVKENKNWKDYSQSELNLMKKCSEWNFFAKEYKKEKSQKGIDTVKFVDGQELKLKQIEKTAEEYQELEEKDPKTFAELKMENGEWSKGNFKWEKEVFKNENQYFSIHKDKNGVKKFIIKERDLPEDFKMTRGE
ncbi:MAG: hypothetical protein WDK96_01365, partial [Candidatus Paceibacterota bacterium]